MAEGYIGEIRAVAFDYAPRDWAMCDGQLIDVRQNSALFALLGNIYGGDGLKTFALPDLRGRTITHVVQGSEKVPTLGKSGGQESITISESQMPEHNHNASFKGLGKIEPEDPNIKIKATVKVNAQSGQGNSNDASNNYWATATQGTTGRTIPDIDNGYSSTSDIQMASDAVTVNVVADVVTVGTTGGGITDGEVTVKNRGGSQPLDIRTPYLTLHYIICMNGLFPPKK